MALDPVCEAEVKADDASPSLTQRGVAYHFCSRHCLERFKATPALYTGARRSADVGPMPKQRRLRIVLGDLDELSRAAHQLRTMKGVEKLDFGTDNLTITYDLRIVMLAQIERVLTENGVALRQGWHGWRRALWRFGESNESENAAQAGSGACCSRPPARIR